jgi:hypothetical protein
MGAAGLATSEERAHRIAGDDNLTVQTLRGLRRRLVGDRHGAGESGINPRC